MPSSLAVYQRTRILRCNLYILFDLVDREQQLWWIVVDEAVDHGGESSFEVKIKGADGPAGDEEAVGAGASFIEVVEEIGRAEEAYRDN